MNKGYEGKRLIMAVAGTMFFAAGMNLFVVSAGLYSGGFLGLGQLIRTLLRDILGVPVPQDIDIAGIVFYMINIPIFAIAWKSLGKKFFFSTMVCVTMQTLFLTFIPTDFKILGDEPFVSAVIGGAMAGYGVGLTLREGGSGGGQDVLGLYMMKANNRFSVGKLALCINIFVYTVCALLYDLETVIYSLVYVAVSSFITDRVHSQNVNCEAKILTKDPKRIQAVIHRFQRTSTIVRGNGSYTGTEIYLIYAAMSGYEARALENEIKTQNIDAFVVFSEVNYIYGKYEKHL